MDYVTLNNGVEIPVLGFGTWDVRGAAVDRIVNDALEAGYRLFDTAHMYENERELGKALATTGVAREELFLTSKLNRPYRSYQKALSGVEQSLNELQTDYLDLYLVHEPYRECEDMYAALQDCYNDGKVRAIGVSNFNFPLFQNLARQASVKPAVNQVESHVYHPCFELKDALNNASCVMQAWGPFTEGRRNIFAEPVLQAVGAQYGKTAGQVALRYLLQNGVAVCVKSAHASRMVENSSVFDFTLTDTDLSRIATLDGHQSLFGWYSDDLI